MQIVPWKGSQTQEKKNHYSQGQNDHVTSHGDPHAASRENRA